MMLARNKILWVTIAVMINRVSCIKPSSRLENFDECGGDFSGYQYLINSPNYPEKYSENQECIYILHGNTWATCNQVFHLQFLNFTLRPSYQCKLDYLQIGDRSVFCGNIMGIRTYSGKNNTLNLRFHSGEGSSDKGFKIRVTTLPCPDSKRKSKKDNSESNLESSSGEDFAIIKYRHLYPVYRPNSVHPLEEDPQQPFTDEKELKDKLNSKKTQDNSTSIFKSLQASTNDSNSSYSKISAYLFASPHNFNDETMPNVDQRLKTVDPKLNNNSELIIPPTKMSPPVKEFTPFSTAQVPTSAQNLTTSASRNNQKLVNPTRGYTPYAPVPGFEPQVQTGEVLDHSTKNVDCSRQINPQLGTSYVPSDEGLVTFPASNYGDPGSLYPPAIEQMASFNVNPTVSNDLDRPYAPPRPVLDGFSPTLNPGTIFPSIAPTARHCCNNLYSSQRFLLASPGFPSRFPGNFYECVYTIGPASSNICRLHFNFKYFNHGIDDQFCGYGHVEIDGRRYCGCKTGSTVVSGVRNNYAPTTLAVKHVGYPRSKFNGFLIEVVQEACSYPGYPLRRKKDVGNTTIINPHLIGRDQSYRVKRELGYSYPKPSIVFEEGIGQTFNRGSIGQAGFTSPSRCQALSFVDWTLAAKETYIRGAKCIMPTSAPNFPNYPGNFNPGYPPSAGGPGSIYPPAPPPVGGNIPGYPGGSGNIYPPVYPPSNGGNFPGYPPIGGTGPGNSFPGYPSPGIPTNPSPGGSPSWGNCEPITVVASTVSSPQYPNVYPNNVNKCYRFYRSPSGCRLQLSILDFDLEDSPRCTKDYILFSNQNTRYCGRSLSGSKTILEFPTNNLIDLRFVTDSFGVGRGFKIGFMQIPCEVIVN